MPRDLFSNQGSTTVSSGGTTAPSQGTTESWTVASSSTFPAASNAASPVTQFYITDPALPAETILVTNVSGTTWSVTRGADGTTPVAHTAGFTVRNVVTAAWLTQAQDASKTRRFDVIEFGADNTGVADSAAAFQACAAAVQAYISATKRATMLIPQGSYKLSDTFTISGGNVTIDARGAYLKMTASKDFFRDYTTQDTTFTLNGKGLRVLGGVWDLDGKARTQSTIGGNSGYSGFTVACSSDIVFHGVTVRNVKSYHGIDINTCDGVVVDSCRFEGFKNSHEWKADVKCASTGPLTLATGFAAGQVIDGYTLLLADRILIKNQAAGQDNGIYTVTAGAPTRVTDMDVAAECNDAAVTVLNGTTQAGIKYVQTATIVTIGTTVQVWSTSWHLQVKAATTGAITLSAPQTVDGVALIAGDRCLVQNQASTPTNGIYQVNAGAWTRVADMNSGATVTAPCSVHVSGGTTYAGKDRTQTATVTTIGTDAQSWSNEYIVDRYFSEAVQIDEGDNNTPSKNIKVVNSYMGPAIDGSGLLSFGKMAGSHTDSPSILYQNIQIIGNTSVGSLSNAFQGDSWADAIIANNIVLGSSERGIRCYFQSSNVGPRVNISGNTISNTFLHGIEIDGHNGTFGDVNISNNTITNTALSSGVGLACGIRVDTCNRVTVAGNQIQNGGTGSQGIALDTVVGGSVTGNSVISAGTLGIQLSTCTAVIVSGNNIYTPNDGGIWASASSTKCTMSDNLIYGANNTTTASADGSIVFSSTATNCSAIGNRIHKGAGSNSTTPFRVQGAGATSIEFNNNSVGSEWGYGGFANVAFSTSSASSTMFIGTDGVQSAILGSDSATITSTTYVVVPNLLVFVPCAGKYRFKAFLQYSQATAGAANKFGVGGTTAASATGAPTKTMLTYTVNYETAVAGTTTTNTAADYLQNTGTGTPPTATVVAVVIDGYCVATSSGTFQIQCASGSVSDAITVKAGSAFIVEKIG